MSDAEKLAVLIACKKLATRAATMGIDIVLHADDIVLLREYERLGEIDDRLRHAAHLLRSDVAILGGLITICDIAADPECALKAVMQRFGIEG